MTTHPRVIGTKVGLMAAAVFLVSAAIIPPGPAQTPADIPALYAEIAGGYEFYIGQKYMVIRISLEQGRLWARAPGDPKSQELQLVDAAGLRFKIDDPTKEQYAVFVSDANGRVCGCRLITGNLEYMGERLPNGNRASRPVDFQFTATDLRSDLLQIRRALEQKHAAIYAFTSILTIRDFGYYQEPDKFKAFVDDAFDQIRRAGVRNLILDLRDNTGGDPVCTTHLLSYLEPFPVPYFARVYPGGYEPFAKPISRAPGAFTGRLFILVNGRCFSSTGHLCALLKYHKVGTFIGTETGGTYECNDASQEIHLRNTRLRLFVPRMTFTAAVRDMPRYAGVLPDIAVEPRVADYLAGKDPVKERALGLVAGARHQDTRKK